MIFKLDYLSTTVCQKLHFLLSAAILRILTRASCACPRTLRVSAHISREDTQDGVSVGGFKMAAMSPVQLYIGQCVYAVVSLAAGGPFVRGPIVTYIFSRVSVGSACVRVWKRDCDVTSLVEHRVKSLQQNGP